MAPTGFGRRFRKREASAVKLLASNVRRLRQAKGWTQDDLAAAIKVEQGVISLIENKRSNPTLLMLDAIAETLGVPIAELFETKHRGPRASSNVVVRRPLKP